jgi:signal transduction histidine kinase
MSLNQPFNSDHAAAYIHDVKNLLSLLMAKSESNHDVEAMHLLMDADYKLNHLLILYKSEVDILSVNIEAISPAYFLKTIAANYQPLTLKKIALEIGDESLVAHFDKGLVELCIGNALHNAERYAKNTIWLSAREERGMTVFSVRDDGDGFSDEILANSGKRGLDSNIRSGLGIYLASKIAAGHINKKLHGYIKISNNDGGVFEMHLP